jgi:caffeoyl-CoA O-methyltransferase
MLSGHLEGQLLKMLVAISKSQQVLEIGVFTGYSALAIAEALPNGRTGDDSHPRRLNPNKT